MSAASECIGFIASALVFLTFAMKDMRQLRIMAIFSNIAFITYASTQALLPILALHLLLLSINLFHLLDAKTKPKQHQKPTGAADKATQMALEAVKLSVVMRSKPSWGS
jgi:hypothetical protein